MERVANHPVLPVRPRAEVPFTFNGKRVVALENEMISSALAAHGIRILGHHHRDGAAQGLYCANGQCSQCTVIADGKPVKSCMTPVSSGMIVRTCDGMPELPALDELPAMSGIETIETECLIIGGGPAGISAAVEIAKWGCKAVLVDDKFELGGKLTLQTHNFFGSRANCYAGMRGIDIGTELADELSRYDDLIEVWLKSPAVGAFCDGTIGVVRDGTYVLVKPETLLVATGAREKSLAFPGCDLPGIYGAGAFQTLVNRDYIRPSRRLFICGGGNVGLIGGYHALQAGIEVAGLVEALPECGGYRVHLDKLKRFGVPVFTSHTITAAHGKEELESVTIAAVDEKFEVVAGTERSFGVDTLLLAVGLTPVDELLVKAREYGIKVCAAGDAEEIAEASAAMLSGRVQGRSIAAALRPEVQIQEKWKSLIQILRDKPGQTQDEDIKVISGAVYPVIRCTQPIPCDPCWASCPLGAIRMQDGTLSGVPGFEGKRCLGCARCVLICPGLAITLVDESYDSTGNMALVTLPFELSEAEIPVGGRVISVDRNGGRLGEATVVAFKHAEYQDRRALILLEVPFSDRLKVAGFVPAPFEQSSLCEVSKQSGDTVICRCERVAKEDIVRLIRAGYRDMNQMKAALRVGMGACGGKTCSELILRLFREEGVDLRDVTHFIGRPPDREVPLGVFAGVKPGQSE